MNELITVSGVRGRLDANGNPELNLEDVARGLGFTQTAKSGNEVVRWERIRKHLQAFGIPTSGDGAGKDGLPDFIPENIFYKLCFKAESQAAITFQDLVTDEILPTIRKHGAYLTPSKIEEVLLNPDTIISLATQLKAEREQRMALQSKVEADKPKVLFASAVETAKTSILVGEFAKILKQNGVDMGQNRFFDWLRENGYLIKRKGTDWNMPTQRSMEAGLFEIKETAIAHADGHTSISKTTKITGKGQTYFAGIFLAESVG